MQWMTCTKNEGEPRKYYKIRQKNSYASQVQWHMTGQLRNIIQVTQMTGAMSEELDKASCLKLLIALLKKKLSKDFWFHLS